MILSTSVVVVVIVDHYSEVIETVCTLESQKENSRDGMSSFYGNKGR